MSALWGVERPTPESGVSGGSSRRRRLAALALSIGFIVLAYALMRSTGRDDSYITYWAARALRETGEIQNISGNRFEQSSTALLTALLAFFSWILHVPIPVVGFAISALFGVSSLYLAGSLAEAIRPGSRLLGVVLAGLLLPLTYWALSGMEMTLAATLITSLVVLATRYPDLRQRRRAVVGVVAGVSLLIAFVRPDTPIYWLIAWVALAIASWVGPRIPGLSKLLGVTSEEWRRLRRVSALFVLSAAASLAVVIAWRWFYFGGPFPAPVGAKVGGLQLVAGLVYLRHTLQEVADFAVLSVLALVSPLVLRRLPDGRWLAAWVVLVVYFGGVTGAGGDWMELARILVPVLPVLVGLVAAMLTALPWRLIFRVALPVALAWLMLFDVSQHSTGSPLGAEVTAPVPARFASVTGIPQLVLANRVHFRDAHFITAVRPTILELARADGGVTVAARQAGMVPYYALAGVPHLKFIDLAGLTSPDLRECVATYGASPGDFGFTWQKIFEVGWQTCGLSRPDVVYGLGQFSETIAHFTHDYCLVTQLSGDVRSTAGWFAGIPLTPRWLQGGGVSNEQFLAVRADLLHLVSNRPCRSE